MKVFKLSNEGIVEMVKYPIKGIESEYDAERGEYICFVWYPIKGIESIEDWVDIASKKGGEVSHKGNWKW